MLGAFAVEDRFFADGVFEAGTCGGIGDVRVSMWERQMSVTGIGFILTEAFDTLEELKHRLVYWYTSVFLLLFFCVWQIPCCLTREVDTVICYFFDQTSL